MRKKLAWHTREEEWLLVQCKKKRHPKDFYLEFNEWRATDLHSLHPDPDFKVPRSYKSVCNKIRKMGYDISGFVVTDDSLTVEDLQAETKKRHISNERQIQAIRESAKALRQRNNKLLRELNFQDRLENLTKKYLKALPPVKVPKPATGFSKGSNEEALLLFSDLHIGEVIFRDEMAGLNEYDFDIFKLRVEYLAKVVIDLCTAKLTGYKIDTLNIAMLGDMVSGTIHDELIETAEGTVIEWAYGGAIVVAQFIMELAQVFPKVNLFGVVGNHGRMSIKPKYKHRYVNWDYVLYMNLVMLLAQQKNISFHFPRSFFIHTNINNNEFVFVHGDNIRSWAGIPFYGINRMVANFSELMASRGDYIKYYCLGHFHQTGQLEKTKGEKILNGSVCGGNEYALGRMFAYTEPKQIFALLHHEKGMTWRIPINLSFANTEKTPKYEYDLNRELVDQFGKILDEDL